MSLTFYGHPLSSYCWKGLVALYETQAPFTFEMVNLGDPAERERFLALSPLGKMPALTDEGLVISESSIVVEHLARRFPDAGLLPPDPDLAREVRYWDRMFDLYAHGPMQRLVNYKLRPSGNDDPFGVAETKAALRAFYDVAERRMNGRVWAVGKGFTLADCAAAPALHYGDKVVPIGEERPALTAYLTRLVERPSFARVLKEAEPFAHFFPGGPD
jgi:glutathione S-transferase